MGMNLITLPEVASTSTWLKENCATLPHGTVALTHNQTAGRGQRGNSWEAAPGMNLTFSLLLRPEGLRPACQFLMSQIVSMAVTDALRSFLDRCVPPELITVKWPNDIYVGNSKIAGILIEHSITGTSIQHSVVGIGLNVNQTEFLSDAPNPVSMAALANRSFPLDAVLDRIVTPLIAAGYDDPDGEIARRYFSQLWRADGSLHPFMLPDGTRFQASVSQVKPDGTLVLALPDGTSRQFLFKEVSFIL